MHFLDQTKSALFSKLRIDFDSINTWHIDDNKSQIVAASAAWKSGNTLLMAWRTVETTLHDNLTCVFENEKLTISFLHSVAAGENK